MSQLLIVAIGGAGGDLPPLVAAALAVRKRGHQTAFIGDRSVGRALSSLGVDAHVLPPELDLGPRLAGAIRDAMAATDGDSVAAGPIVEQRMAEWAGEVAQPISRATAERRPDAVVTSLFGVEVLQRAEPRCPWAVINSTFYLGPNSARPIEEDVGARAIPLLSRYARLAAAAARWHGRPMVLMPWGRDQPGVAARARALGVAEVVQRGENAEVELANAVDRVLADSNMQNAATAHAERLRETEPPRLTASLLESLIRC